MFLLLRSRFCKQATIENEDVDPKSGVPGKDTESVGHVAIACTGVMVWH